MARIAMQAPNGLARLAAAQAQLPEGTHTTAEIATRDAWQCHAYRRPEPYEQVPGSAHLFDTREDFARQMLGAVESKLEHHHAREQAQLERHVEEQEAAAEAAKALAAREAERALF